MICKTEYLDGERCKNVDTCELRHPLIEKYIWTEILIQYDIDPTIDYVKNLKSI